MFFADIHIHILCNTDDGPHSAEAMFRLADYAYNHGTRLICATPHFAPSEFGRNVEKAQKSFDMLFNYCKEKYKDLQLFLGNELLCDGEEVRWLKNGYCKSLNGTRYVLVEYPIDESEKNIVRSLESLLCAGYVPILAHTERYKKLRFGTLALLKDDGVLLQVNAKRAFGINLSESLRVKRILSSRMADIVSTDAHNTTTRPPNMQSFYEYVRKKHGESYARDIFYKNALDILTEGNNGK